MAEIEVADGDSDGKTKEEIIAEAIQTRAAARSKNLQQRTQSDYEKGLTPY
jgi:hypothetical protein